MAGARQVALVSHPSVLRWGWWAECHHSSSQCPHGQAELLQASLTTWVPGQHGLHSDAQHTLSEEQHMAHRSVNTVVNRSLLWIFSSSTIFMDLALCPQSFPVTTTTQPLAPLSIMNHRTLQQALIGQDLGVWSLYHGDSAWTKAQIPCGSLFCTKLYLVLREAEALLHTAVNSDPMTLLTKNILCSGG